MNFILHGLYHHFCGHLHDGFKFSGNRGKGIQTLGGKTANSYFTILGLELQGIDQCK